jgi:type I restriction enzyme S subunit
MTALGDIADFVMGQAPPGADCNFEGKGTPFVKAGEFGEKRPIIREWTTRPLKRALASDVLVCVVGATSGKINLGADCAIGRSVAAIRPRPATFAEFLYYQLLPKVLDLRQKASGSAQGVISKTLLASIPIFLPPLEEQRHIVTKLDSLFARSKRARIELDRIPELVERYKKATLTAAFQGRLTTDWRERRNDPIRQPDEIRSAVLAERENRRRIEGIRSKGANRNIPADVTDLSSLPNGWAWLTFDQCSWDLTVGHVGPMKDRYVASGIPFLRSLNVKPNRIDVTDVVYIDSDFDQELRKSKLTTGTVVVVRTGAPGVSAVIPSDLDGANCSDLVICRPVASLDPHYAAHFINSGFAQGIVAGFQVGVAQQHFNVGAMSKLAVPYAPIEEQKEIVRRIDTTFACLDKIATERARATALLSRLEEMTLAKAFRGELISQDSRVTSLATAAE